MRKKRTAKVNPNSGILLSPYGYMVISVDGCNNTIRVMNGHRVTDGKLKGISHRASTLKKVGSADVLRGGQGTTRHTNSCHWLI